MRFKEKQDEEVRAMLVSEAEEQMEKYEEFDAANRAIEQFKTEIRRLKHMSEEDVYIQYLENERRFAQEIIDMAKFRPENQAEVGDYLVYQSHVPNNLDFEKFDFEITPKTVYNLILKVNEVGTIDRGQTEVQAYGVELVAFDNEWLEIWPNHFINSDGLSILPNNQSDITVYEKNPMGSISTKVLDAAHAKDNYMLM